MALESSSIENEQPGRSPRFGLSGKLLLLTILFVMIAEVLIYVPSIANFRLNWLSDRLAVARTVSVVLSARTVPEELDPNDGRIKLPDTVIQQILDSLGAKTVAIKMGNQRKPLAVNDLPHEIHHNVDLRDATAMRAVWAALQTLLLRSDSDIVRVVGQVPPGADFIEMVIEEGPLCQAMFRSSRNIVFLSLIMSAITAAL